MDIVGVVYTARAGDWTAAWLRIAAHYVFDCEIDIKRVIDCLTHFQICEDGIAQVELDGRVRDVVFEALGSGVETAIFLKTLGIRHGNAVKGSFHHFTRFKRRSCCSFIGQEAPDDTIKIREFLAAPIVIVALGNNVLPALVFNEFEWASTHRC